MWLIGAVENFDYVYSRFRTRRIYILQVIKVDTFYMKLSTNYFEICSRIAKYLKYLNKRKISTNLRNNSVQFYMKRERGNDKQLIESVDFLERNRKGSSSSRRAKT